MTRQQALALAALAAAAGIATATLRETTVVQSLGAEECSWQPAGAPPIPCSADGGWSAGPSYQDAGCLGLLCPRVAGMRARGGGGSILTDEELAAKQAALIARLDAGVP